MKITPYLSLAAVFLIIASKACSADADLVGLIKGGQQSSAILKYLEPNSAPSQATDEHFWSLKRIIAFGGAFEGELSFNGDVQAKLLMWTQDPSITPQAGVEVFEKMVSALRREFGQGKVIASIPNYGDASDVKSTAVLWPIETDIVLLQLDRYPSRAGINVMRQSSESWRSSMGADESDFWAQTLDPKTDVETPPDIEWQHAPSIGSAPVLFQSETKREPNEETPPSVGSGAPTLTTPLSIIAVLTVAAIGLQWLRVKKRK